MNGDKPERHRRSDLALIGVGIAAGTMMIRIPSLSEPRWYFDDGVFTTVAWAMSRGFPLYARVYDLQPPGIYWLYRLILMFGADQHHFVEQIVAALFVVATAVLTFGISVRFMPLRPAALAGSLTGLVLSIPTLDGDLLNVEIAGLPFFLASLLLAFSRRWPAIVGSGVLLGVALVMRPTFAIDGLALLVPLLCVGRGGQRVLVAGAGLAATLVMVIAALSVEGSLQAFMTVVVPFDHAYAVRANGGTLTPLFLRLVVLGTIGVIGVTMAKSVRGRLLAIWLPASIAGASVTPLEYTHYFHEAVPALAFAIAIRVAGFRWRWIVAPQAALALVIFAESILILPAQQTAVMQSVPPPLPFLHNFGYQDLPAYYGNWLAFASRSKSQSQYDQWFAEVGRQEAEVALLRRLAGSSSARLLVLGGRPWIYFESGLLPATPHVATCGSPCMAPSDVRGLHTTLSSGCADLVVVVDQLSDWLGDLEAGGYVPIERAPWPTFQSSHSPRPCA